MENEAEIPAVRHPGAELGDMLARMDMTRQELALRAGVSEKHIDAVVAGSLDISLPFAKRLECAIGVSARKWMEMQLRYDESVFEQKEQKRTLREHFLLFTYTLSPKIWIYLGNTQSHPSDLR